MVNNSAAGEELRWSRDIKSSYILMLLLCNTTNQKEHLKVKVRLTPLLGTMMYSELAKSKYSRPLEIFRNNTRPD